MAIRYWTGSHTKHKLVYHLVFIPKYRKRILVGKVAKKIRSLMYEACEMNRWWIHEIDVKRDHVHVMIQIKPTDKVSGEVKILKGGSSIKIQKEYPELEEFVWGGKFWSDGYFAETSGRLSEVRLRSYIREQCSSMTRKVQSPGL
ncbi:MAG: IS200/IS605 family transposase [Patescibacteria group bacterium]|nr:IS200/IS605 family transposase [Patescibacteria group bacterium]